jgi:hypothetical protein
MLTPDVPFGASGVTALTNSDRYDYSAATSLGAVALRKSGGTAAALDR